MNSVTPLRNQTELRYRDMVLLWRLLAALSPLLVRFYPGPNHVELHWINISWRQLPPPATHWQKTRIHMFHGLGHLTHKHKHIISHVWSEWPSSVSVWLATQKVILHVIFLWFDNVFPPVCTRFIIWRLPLHLPYGVSGPLQLLLHRRIVQRGL